jgi:hypothetical protein
VACLAAAAPSFSCFCRVPALAPPLPPLPVLHYQVRCLLEVGRHQLHLSLLVQGDSKVDLGGEVGECVLPGPAVGFETDGTLLSIKGDADRPSLAHSVLAVGATFPAPMVRGIAILEEAPAVRAISNPALARVGVLALVGEQTTSYQLVPATN